MSGTSAPAAEAGAARLGDRAIELLPPGPAASVFTVDVEDWFHANFESLPGADTGAAERERRAGHGVDRILELLARHGAEATFFVLGCVARADPSLVPRIASAGHEVACHGLHHRLVHRQAPEAFRDDVVAARALLREQSGQEVLGFRAPSWSITAGSLWAFDVVAEAGFAYSSSVFPAPTRLYGIAGAPRTPYRVPTRSGRALVEVPPPVLAIGPWRIGVAGGFYLRALPLAVHLHAMRRSARRGAPFLAYVHPRELDPGAWHLKLPLSASEQLIHRFRLPAAERRAAGLLRRGRWRPLGRVLRERGAL